MLPSLPQTLPIRVRYCMRKNYGTGGRWLRLLSSKTPRHERKKPPSGRQKQTQGSECTKIPFPFGRPAQSETQLSLSQNKNRGMLQSSCMPPWKKIDNRSIKNSQTKEGKTSGRENVLGLNYPPDPSSLLLLPVSREKRTSNTITHNYHCGSKIICVCMAIFLLCDWGRGGFGHQVVYFLFCALTQGKCHLQPTTENPPKTLPIPYTPKHGGAESTPLLTTHTHTTRVWTEKKQKTSPPHTPNNSRATFPTKKTIFQHDNTTRAKKHKTKTPNVNGGACARKHIAMILRT